MPNLSINVLKIRHRQLTIATGVSNVLSPIVVDQEPSDARLAIDVAGIDGDHTSTWPKEAASIAKKIFNEIIVEMMENTESQCDVKCLGLLVGQILGGGHEELCPSVIALSGFGDVSLAHIDAKIVDLAEPIDN